jgi:anaerobic magnesium-protoporphyrin IX monomethyl ester cyclase
MNILLANPPMPGIYHRMGLIMPPLGVMYIASFLRAKGHDVEIVDLNMRNGGGSIDFSPFDLVGVSSDTPRTNDALEIARGAKEAGKTVVMGGPHPSFQDEEILGTGWANFIVRGEGEATLVSLVEALEGGRREDLEKVKGISFLNEEGNLVRTPQPDYLEDLDNLPYPSRDLVKLETYKQLSLSGRRMTSILTSRGCPYDCSFCSANKIVGRTWRARKPSNIVDEMEWVMEEYPFKAFCLVDDNFTLNVRRVDQMCDEILERGLNIRWWCMSRSDIIAKNEPLVEKMARSGCDVMFIGLESGSQKSLENYHKNSSVEIGEKAVTTLKKHGIDTHASFIIGDLDETHEDIQKTLDYALDLDPFVVQFSIMTPYPGTRLFESIKKRIYERNWTKFDGTHGVFQTNHFAPGELEKILKDIYKKFYLRPRRLLQGLGNLLRGYHMNIGKVRALFQSLSS